MKTKNQKANQAGSLNKGFNNPLDEVILEVMDKDDARRFIVPHKEWLLIKEWYCDPSAVNDYCLDLNTGEDPYTIIRLDKKLSCIKAWGLTHSMVLSKNISSILLHPVPRIIRFSTAFILSLILWAVFMVAVLVKGAEINLETIYPMTKVTPAVFTVFLLFELEFVIFRVVDSFRNKLKPFLYETETSVTASLVFNLILMAIFALKSPLDIISLISSILGFLGV